MQAPIFALNQPANQPAGSFYEAVMLSCSTCPLCQVGSKETGLRSCSTRLLRRASTEGCFTKLSHQTGSEGRCPKPLHWVVLRTRSIQSIRQSAPESQFIGRFHEAVLQSKSTKLFRPTLSPGWSGKPLHQAVPLGHSAHPLWETAPQSRPTMLPTESFCQVSLAGRSAKPPYKEAPRKCDHATSSRSRLLRCHFARYLQNAFSPTLACTHLYYRGNE